MFISRPSIIRVEEIKVEVEVEPSPIKREGKLHHVVSSRLMLLAVVVLNVTDCLLVTTALILDIHYMKSVSEHAENIIENKTSKSHLKGDGEEGYLTEAILAHNLHFASVAILGILSLEVFDAFVVIASFIVDLVLIEGITSRPIGVTTLIMSFLLPWRVVRVVNSLLVAMLAREHFKRVLIYTSKRRLEKEIDETLADLHVTRLQVHALKAMCVNLGEIEWKVNKKLSTIGRPSDLPLYDLYMFKENHQKMKKLRKKMDQNGHAANCNMLAQSRRGRNVANTNLGQDNKGLQDQDSDDDVSCDGHVTDTSSQQSGSDNLVTNPDKSPFSEDTRICDLSDRILEDGKESIDDGDIEHSSSINFVDQRTSF